MKYWPNMKTALGLLVIMVQHQNVANRYTM